ncbi:uncharacterized protein BO80DRAFT_14782 [Aspergillus ibericus CBS 121593]|uniref:Uncharacterized protein n=1 Tax=Aspergillus ibericus CBS 121593 TaxID=1448316 RepID=A0A395H5M5_9EURO|nr:hypothetical protein BO80DRAFT_14782 [Aspergillus ibericus CBS 121593]RAL03177.1 hypothetical protein BO80DRAFT_14782 [Aspergillus ibericus CBS 121593]
MYFTSLAPEVWPSDKAIIALNGILATGNKKRRLEPNRDQPIRSIDDHEGTFASPRGCLLVLVIVSLTASSLLPKILDFHDQPHTIISDRMNTVSTMPLPPSLMMAV